MYSFKVSKDSYGYYFRLYYGGKRFFTSSNTWHTPELAASDAFNKMVHRASLDRDIGNPFYDGLKPLSDGYRR